MEPANHPPAARWTLIALLALIVLGAVLRLTGIGYGLPEIHGHDERVFAQEAQYFRDGTPPPSGTTWVLSAYPHLLPRLAAVLPDPGSEHEAADWVQGRSLLAWLSLLSVPLTWLLARRWMGNLGALAAAGLMATSLLQISLAIQLKPHAVGAALDLLALLAVLRLGTQPSTLRLLTAGLAAALALGALHSGALCLPPLFVAVLQLPRKSFSELVRRLLIAFAPVAASVVLFLPFLLPGAAQGPRGAGASGFGGMLLAKMHGSRAFALLRAIWELDPVLVTLAAVGLVLVLARWRSWLSGERLVLLVYVLPYTLVLALYQDTLVRFFLPLAPLLACCAGLAFERASARLPGSPRLLALVVLALPCWPAAHFAWIRTQPSPHAQAARWIEEHVEPGETLVLVPYIDLPLWYTSDTAAANARWPDRSPWSEYQLEHPDASRAARAYRVLVEPGERPDSRQAFARDPRAYLAQAGAHWLVFDLSGGGLEDSLSKVATRVARFTPARVDDGKARGILLAGTGIDALRPSAARILRMRSLGTTVEIWRLR